MLRTDKFASRAVNAVFMGYSSITKGYVTYDLERHKFLVNRDDVIFTETVFPLQLNMYPSIHPSLGSFLDEFPTTDSMIKDMPNDTTSIHVITPTSDPAEVIHSTNVGVSLILLLLLLRNILHRQFQILIKLLRILLFLLQQTLQPFL